ncbi:MAG: secretion system protein E, partial [Candidatus Omnitrophica bacterium]|nr:secretion system protein E [Candidatus Omnitrophota bacterium]
MASLKERIVKELISRKLLTPEQLEEATTIQRTNGGNLHAILVDKGFVKEHDLLAAISQGLGIPPITLSRMRLDPELKHLVPRDVALQYEVIPVSSIGGILTVAMADPLNIFALDTLSTLTGLSIRSLLTTPREIRE